MRSGAVLLLALGLAGCALDPAPARDPAGERVFHDALGRPAYATLARAREDQLRVELQAVFAGAKREAQQARAQLAERMLSVQPPPRLATRERYLTSLGRAEAETYEEQVGQAYAQTLARLDAIRDQAQSKALALAAAKAPERSPLDDGATGDASLDRQVAAFEEVLRMELAREELQGQGYRQAVQRLELLEVFSSFNAPGADERLGGRLLVFVGGDDRLGVRSDVVLRVASGVSPQDRGLVQAVRFRIMSGDTIVRDLGWRPLPAPDGLPAVTQQGSYVLAPDVAPDLLAQLGSLDGLLDRRILADVQTAVFDSQRKLLGGADWRLEYRVSGRGRMSWQVAAVEPRFDAECLACVDLLAAASRSPAADR